MVIDYQKLSSSYKNIFLYFLFKIIQLFVFKIDIIVLLVWSRIFYNFFMFIIMRRYNAEYIIYNITLILVLFLNYTLNNVLINECILLFQKLKQAFLRLFIRTLKLRFGFQGHWSFSHAPQTNWAPKTGTSISFIR